MAVGKDYFISTSRSRNNKGEQSRMAVAEAADIKNQ